MFQRSRVSRVVGCVLAAVLVSGTMSSNPPAGAVPTCPPQRSGQWSGDLVAPGVGTLPLTADLTFGESTVSGSFAGFAVDGTISCNALDATLTDPSSGLSGPLVGVFVSDGMSGSGEVGAGNTWSLTLTTQAPPTVSVGSASVQEGNGGTRVVEIPVTLSRPATSTVKVSYATFGLSSADLGDYVPKTGTLSFAPGASGLSPVTKWIKVVIRGDVSHELDETFGVALSNPIGATVNASEGAVLIQDDDTTAGPVVTISTSSLYEGDEAKRTLTLVLWLSQPSSVPVEVEYSTGDGTALAPGDYRPKSDELTFLPGQVRKAVSIPVVPDDLAEGSLEEFTGYLLSTVGAPIDRDFGTFTIFDE